MHIHRRDFYDRTLAPKREIDVLRARSPAGRRFRASALVYGRKITMYMHTCAPFSSLRFRRLGSVVGPVRQVFPHSDPQRDVPIIQAGTWDWVYADSMRCRKC